MGLSWADFKRVLDGERLPVGVVDLDALTANARVLSERLGAGKTLRVASKSIRHTGLMRRILAIDQQYRGLMCFHADEVGFLADEGFDDLLLAYPTVQPGPLARVAECVSRGTTAWLVVDHTAHLDALARAGAAAGTELKALIEVDTSWRPLGAVHVGARRSPVRTPEHAVALARYAQEKTGVRVAGIMAYEAHVAGVQDDTPFGRWMNGPKRWMKRQAQPHVAQLREAVVRALEEDGHVVELVNGGGTGSVGLTTAEPVVTEVAAGSGFLCSHLFSYFAGLDLEPALFFALEASRSSDPGYITCGGVGIVASGEPGWDKLPLPWRPEGLSFVAMEGAGEVQTPLTLARDTPPIAIGDPVVFRPAKAGEPAERFAHYVLVRDGRRVAREPTYRGQGKTFL